MNHDPSLAPCRGEQLALIDARPAGAATEGTSAAADQPRATDSQTLLTAAEIARRLGVTERYVWSLGRRGILPRILLPGGRLVRFAQADLDALLASRRTHRAGRPDDPAAG